MAVAAASPFLSSTIGQKTLMAITGFFLSGFVLIHMLGHLQMFVGPDQYNDYAHALKSNLLVLWGARSGLLALLLVHLFNALSLKFRNQAARPVPYQNPATLQATFSSRTMIYTGLTLLAFILFHLAHYTLFIINPEFADLMDAKGHPDAYRMMVLGFQNPIISLSYLFFMACLALHLNHGIPSIFQTLGANNRKWQPRYKLGGFLYAAIVFVGFSIVPLAILGGIIQ